MLNWVIIWQRPNATHCTVRIPNARNQREGETEVEFQQRLSADIAASGGTVIAVVDRAEMPDRHYRAAWSWNGRGLAVDETEARAIELRRLKWLRELSSQRMMTARARAEAQGNAARAAELQTKINSLWALNLSAELSGLTAEQMKTARPLLFGDPDLGMAALEPLCIGHQSTDPPA